MQKVSGSPAGMAEDPESTLDWLGNLMSVDYARGSVSFDSQATTDSLAGTSIYCPRVDAAVLEKYLSYFIQCGFLEAGCAVRSS
jgi:hypothetical protein